MNKIFFLILTLVPIINSDIYGAATIIPQDDPFELRDAIKSNDIHKARRLIESGNWSDVLKIEGGNFITCAAIKKNKQMIELLLKAGVHVDAVDSDSNTALIWAAYNENIEIVRILLSAGANINAVNLNNDSAITRAIQKQNPALVKLLLEAGASKNSLFAALKDGDKNTLEFLLKCGIEINSRDATGNTALMGAIVDLVNDNSKLISQLIDAKADINIVNNEGQSALDLAIWKFDDKLAKKLISLGASVNEERSLKLTNAILLKSAYRGDLEEVRTAINSGANIEATNTSLETALMYASCFGHIDIAKLLLDLKANVNSVDKQGRSALRIAVASVKWNEFARLDAGQRSDKSVNMIGVIKLLLAYGADLDNIANLKRTPARRAAFEVLGIESARRASIIEMYLKSVKEEIAKQLSQHIIPQLFPLIGQYCSVEFEEVPLTQRLMS